ncbi:putative fatty acyl-CoA reductase CG5065 isoform X2 [Periplaneta americana]
MTVITDWYRDQTILVTGGTGFMGKVLLEKLLRSCPGVRRIYVLARAKRGTAPSARIEAMAKLPLFENVIKSNPNAMKKLVAVECDFSQPDLGLQKEIRRQLISEVTLVFNMAASLRLEAGMKDAIANNTTGTKRILDLCLQMKHLKAFTHLSTAFCHCEFDVLEEKIYPPPHNPHDVMRAMEWLDDKSIEMITPRLLGPHPNCYTYSKRLTEALVNEYRDRIPVSVFRPSIVIPTYKDPIPGWVDTLNGPVGVLVAAGKGVLSSMMCNEKYQAEVIPVDIAINAILIATWKLAVDKYQEVPVYNVTTGSLVSITWGDVMVKGIKLIRENPFEVALSYPEGHTRTNWLYHYLWIMIFHYLPAYLIDFLFLLARQKRFMVRVQKRIMVGLDVLQYFTTRPWYFKNDRFLSFEKNLSPEDRELFYVTNTDYDVDKYLLHAVLGVRQYCVKEPLSSLPKARRLLFILYCIRCITRIAFFSFLVWLLLKYVESARVLLNYSTEMLQHLPVVGSLVPRDLESSTTSSFQ